MKTFAERLKLALEKKRMSQTEAARRCKITQQTINYIINNNLKSSKLAPNIAAALGINPEWLMYGTGRFEEMQIFEIPILSSPYELLKFINSDIDLDSIKHTVIDADLGFEAFAYLLNPSEIIICSNLHKRSGCKYLTLRDNIVQVTNKKKNFSFAIFEWRIRHETY